MPDPNHPATKAADALAMSSVVANVLGWLPTTLTVISTLITIIYFSLQIYESNTVKGWRKKP